ncbi:MAG: DNA/RNA non-specific endonuclease, partial [Saonia sp.]
IGEEDVAVPKYYYKIISRGEGNSLKVVAFLIPHKESTAPLQQFLVPVDRIEQLTGIDFFKNVQTDIENRIESKVDSKDWKF